MSLKVKQGLDKMKLKISFLHFTSLQPQPINRYLIFIFTHADIDDGTAVCHFAFVSGEEGVCSMKVVCEIYLTGYWYLLLAVVGLEAAGGRGLVWC